MFSKFFEVLMENLGRIIPKSKLDLPLYFRNKKYMHNTVGELMATVPDFNDSICIESCGVAA